MRTEYKGFIIETYCYRGMYAYKVLRQDESEVLRNEDDEFELEDEALEAGKEALDEFLNN